MTWRSRRHRTISISPIMTWIIINNGIGAMISLYLRGISRESRHPSRNINIVFKWFQIVIVAMYQPRLVTWSRSSIKYCHKVFCWHTWCISTLTICCTKRFFIVTWADCTCTTRDRGSPISIHCYLIWGKKAITYITLWLLIITCTHQATTVVSRTTQ